MALNYCALFLSLVVLSLAPASHSEQRASASTDHEPVPVYSPLRMIEAIQSGEKVLFIDVREPEEYAEGHIPGAINIPQRDFKARLAEIDRDALVIPYCNMDFRGFIAARALRDLGVRRVVLMQERGINGWRAQGLPVSGPAPDLSEADALARLRFLPKQNLLGERYVERAPATGVRHHITMEAAEWYFEPNDLEVEAGDEIHLSIASSKGNHFFIQPDYELALTLTEGARQKVVFLADRPGDYRFGSCEWDGAVLQVMKGRLRVRPPGNAKAGAEGAVNDG